MTIWAVVLAAITTVLFCILVLRLHAFVTLLLAGFLVAVLSNGPLIDRYVTYEVNRDKMTRVSADSLAGKGAATRLADEFGKTAGKIGILIALASIIGQSMLESQAATVIVERLLRWTGPKRAPEAMAASAFVLGIPVFFDTVFYLMVPLARSLRRKVGSDYVLFILAIFAGGSIAHSLVPPTPGPLLVAGIIGVDVATMMLAGLSIGLISSFISLMVARIINRQMDVPLRPIVAESQEDGPTGSPSSGAVQALPGFAEALLPILIPVLLIGLASLTQYAIESEDLTASGVTDCVLSLGEKNVALGVGVVFALSLVRYCPAGQRSSLIGRSLSSAGTIILITSAGGAFGAMLRQAGIEEAVAVLTVGMPGLMLLPVAFFVTASIRTVQGSATVAMITAAGILQGIAQVESLPFHPVYLAMAIGAGSKPVSWMTDSGFWIITRMSGLTESEGLRTVSVMSVAMGFSALAVTMLFAALYPGV